MAISLSPSQRVFRDEYIFIEESRVLGLLNRLGRYAGEPEVRSFLRAASRLIKDEIVENFISGGRSGVGGWVPLHWITGALRRQPAGAPKIHGFGDLVARTRGFTPLNTGTGNFKKQITRKVEFGEDFVRVGTTNQMVIKHHRGFTEKFRFSGFYKHQLNRNIARETGGRYNPFYGWIFGELHGIDGDTRRTPARPMYFVLTGAPIRQLVTMARKALTDMVTRRARSA